MKPVMLGIDDFKKATSNIHVGHSFRKNDIGWCCTKCGINWVNENIMKARACMAFNNEMLRMAARHKRGIVPLPASSIKVIRSRIK